MTEKLDGLLETFGSLEKIVSDRKFEADEQSLIKSVETSIENCNELIHELQDECQKFAKISANGIIVTVKVIGRRATYPFRQSTLQKLDENIDEIRFNLSPALDVLQLKDNKRIQDDITEVKLLLDLIRSSQISSSLRDWLKAPDATIDHYAACAKKYPGTGIWLVKSDHFSRWLTEANSMIWLHGFAGSGKSILCSTAIQFALRHRRSNPDVGIAFFYFTFNDKSKQDDTAMLRALLLQFSGQLQDGHEDLARLRDSCQTGIPPSRMMIDHLQRLVQRFRDVYIVLDALDESPRNGSRKHVLDALEAMRNWGLQCVHLFVTSRDESDIRESLDLLLAHQVEMQNSGIDKDISNFISGRLDTDRRLRKLLPYREKIQESLAARAKGMFRWVDCQFEALQLCPSSEYHLDHMLSSLPESLDETYERMLCNINYNLIEDARRILTLLCFARRPLTVPELIEGVAVEINNSVGLNPKRRLQDFNGIRDICGSFINIGLDVDHTTENQHEKESIPTVRIAHFSVQEYLESERIRHQKAAMFSLISATAHAEIAQICLMYLLEPGLSRSKLEAGILEGYPLALYAAKDWYYYHQNTAKPAPGVEDCVLRLFQRQDSFVTWTRLCNVDSPRSKYRLRLPLTNIPTPVYGASLLGLDRTLRELLNSEELEGATTSALPLASTSKVSKLINARGGRYDNALQAASYSGHDNVVQMLLDGGADVNLQGGLYNNALQAASINDHGKTVQVLLDKGADVNVRGGVYGNALQAASYMGYDNVMQILLDRGADVNVQGGVHGNALQAAAHFGHENAIQLLLNRGADINAQGGPYVSALQAASVQGHENAIQLLLNRGADINAQGGPYVSALQAASVQGHENAIQLLLNRGADINAQGGPYVNALQAALVRGHDKVVQLLIDHGVRINAKDLDITMRLAERRRNNKLVQLLKNHEAALRLEPVVTEEARGNQLTLRSRAFEAPQ